jgi:hypothetical protein
MMINVDSPGEHDPRDMASKLLLDQLENEAARFVRGALDGYEIRQIWTEPNRILFRLADGRTGDVENQVNFDVLCEPTSRRVEAERFTLEAYVASKQDRVCE